jgi:hypothetical protein
MKINKVVISKIFMILLGVSSLLLAYKDWSTGIATRKGVDTSREEYPTLFTFETVSKVVFGILIIGIAFLPQNKDEQSNDE